jgi:hypothetical protein
MVTFPGTSQMLMDINIGMSPVMVTCLALNFQDHQAENANMKEATETGGKS